MRFRKSDVERLARTLPVCAVLCFASLPSPTRGQFVESDVTVLHTFSTASGQLGWGVADLVDIDTAPDGVMDMIIPAPADNVVYVRSGSSGALLWTLTPPSGARLGHAVADAGDVNNDGVHDILAGAPGTAASDPGRAFVFSGADGSVLLSVFGEAAGDGFGSAVGGIGDVNADDHDDFVVGAPANDIAGNGSGRVYVFSGIDGSLIQALDGETSTDRLGAGTAGTGDIDGDGVGDFIVGAPGAGPTNDGKAYVYSGVDRSLIFEETGDINGSAYGQFFVDGVGDVNGDGVRDVTVGDYAAPGGGKTYVYSGAGGALLYKFNGPVGEGVGTSGQYIGDVNNDGFNDVLVGHWTSSAGGPTAGRVTIRSGKTGITLRTITSTTGGENFGFDAVGIGDVNGDGYIDILVSASTQNRVYVIAGTDLHCTVASAPAAPDAAGIDANRYLSLRPNNGSQKVALRVKLISVNGFPGFDGQVRWVGSLGTYPEGTNPNPNFKASALQCTSNFQAWSAAPLLRVFGAEITPGSTYEVQTINENCDPAFENSYSTGLTLHTGKWGDVVTPFGGNGQPNFQDITAIVDKFKGTTGASAKFITQLQPNVPNPANPVAFLDISAAVDAFKGKPYGFSGPVACP